MPARLRLLVGLLVLALLMVGCADAPGEATDSSEGAASAVPPKTAVSDLQKASDTKDATDTRLGNALGRVGPMITSEQSKAFATAFNALPDVVAAETDYQTKSQVLADSLADVASDPAKITSYGAKNLLAAYALLAKTPAAGAALDFGTKVLAKQITLDGVTDSDVLDQVVGPSLAGAYVDNLLKTGTVQSATAATVKVLSTGSSIALQIAGWLQRYNAFQQVDVFDDLLGVSSESTFASLRTIAGVIAIWTIGDDLFEGNATQAMHDFLSSGGSAITGVASATSLFRRVIIGVDKTPLADEVIKWAGKIAGGIGLVMNAIALWNDSGKWNDSAAAKVRVAADVVAIAASILCLVATGPIGPVLATAALGLSFFATWLEDRRIAAQELADIKACMPALGLDPTLTDTIVNADPTLVNNLSQDVGLAPDEVQWLISVDPNVVSSDAMVGVTWSGLQAAQKIFTLDAGKTTDLLKASVGTETDPAKTAEMVDALLRGLNYGQGWNADLTAPQALDWLATEETDPDADASDAPLRTAAFTGAHDYLAALQ